MLVRVGEASDWMGHHGTRPGPGGAQHTGAVQVKSLGPDLTAKMARTQASLSPLPLGPQGPPRDEEEGRDPAYQALTQKRLRKP